MTHKTKIIGIEKQKNARVINNIWIDQNISYEALKKLMQPTMSSNELINLTRKYTKNLISLAEKYIKLFREYINGVITEDTLISSVAPISKQISTWYFRQSGLPIPPKELHDWANCHCNLANIIDDFTLFYGENNFRSRTAENRKSLVQMTIERYNVALEQLKSAELNIENII